MAITVAELLIRVEANTKPAEEGLQRLGKAVDATGKSAGTAEGSIKGANKAIDETGKKSVDSAKRVDDFQKGMTKASLAMTAGFAALGALSLKWASDFEFGIDQVGAVANATEQEIESLRKEALQIGADTKFSAGQATAAMEELAAGGRSAAQIIGGEAAAAASLAAAGNYDLANSARTVATAMDLWGESGISMIEIVNRITGVANTSRFGVEDMSTAIAQGGGAAKVAGVDFADFSTTIAATASAFSSGSDAGTSFKTFITALPGNSDKAKDAIKELGLEFYNADGSMRSMAEITQELHDKLGPLSEQQQVVALKTIFGNDAMRTAAQLMELTGAEFEAMSKQMKDTDAADVAAQRMGNLKSQTGELMGALETLGIQVATRAVPALTELTGGAQDAVNAFGELPASTQNILLLGTVAATATPAIAKGIGKITGALTTLDDEGARVLGTRGKIAIGLAAFTAGLAVADGLMAKFSGHGIFERLLGDPAKADAATKAVKGWNVALLAAGDTVDHGTVLQGEFNKLLGETRKGALGLPGGFGGWGLSIGGQIAKVGTALTGIKQPFWDAVENTKGLEENTRFLTQQMISSGWSIRQIKDAYDQLPPSLQEVMNDVIDVDGAWRQFQANAADDHLRGLAAGLDAVKNKAVEIIGPIETLPPSVLAAQKAITDFGLSADGAALEVDDLNKKISGFIALTTDLDPKVASARAQHAALTEELDDLKAKGEELTAAERARIDQIEKELLPAVEKEISASDSNKKALEDQAAQLSLLMGPAGYGALLKVMQEGGRSSEDMATKTGKLSDAYYKMEHDDVPGAIAKLQELRGEMTDEEWAIASQAIGPDLIEAIRSGVSNPEEQAKLLIAVATLIQTMGATGLTEAQIAGVAAGTAYITYANGVISTWTPPSNFVGPLPPAGYVYSGQHYAAGTDYARGGLSLVGEEGPELVMMPRGAKVFTASETRQLLGGGSLQDAGVDVGAAFADGIAAGMLTGSSATKDAAMRLLGATVTSMEAAAGIHSPSTLFAQVVGIPIAQGVAVGIETGTPTAADAAVNMVTIVQGNVVRSLADSWGTISDEYAQGWNVITDRVVSFAAAAGMAAGKAYNDAVAATISVSTTGVVTMNPGADPGSAMAVNYPDFTTQMYDTRGVVVTTTDYVSLLSGVRSGAIQSWMLSPEDRINVEDQYARLGGPPASFYDDSMKPYTTGQNAAGAIANSDPQNGAHWVQTANGWELVSNDADGSHWGGLKRVPRDNYLARLHMDEAVLTAPEARKWRDHGSGMSVTIQAIDARSFIEMAERNASGLLRAIRSEAERAF